MTDSTRGLGRLLLALAYAGGAVLVLLLLAKGSADALSGRTVITALSVLVLGLVSAAGLRAAERPGLESLWGYATLLIAVVTFILIMVEAWSEHPFYLNDTRIFVMLVISFLLGGGSLVLGNEQEREGQAIRNTRLVSLLSLVVLGILTVLSVSGVHIGHRWFGVAATVFLVSALSLPLLRLVAEEDRAGS